MVKHRSTHACRLEAIQTTVRQLGTHDTVDRAIRNLRYTSIVLGSDKRTRYPLYGCLVCRPDGRNDVLYSQTNK